MPPQFIKKFGDVANRVVKDLKYNTHEGEHLGLSESWGQRIDWLRNQYKDNEAQNRGQYVLEELLVAYPTELTDVVSRLRQSYFKKDIANGSWGPAASRASRRQLTVRQPVEHQSGSQWGISQAASGASVRQPAVRQPRCQAAYGQATQVSGVRHVRCQAAHTTEAVPGAGERPRGQTVHGHVLNWQC
jgi:hypothetical protein